MVSLGSGAILEFLPFIGRYLVPDIGHGYYGPEAGDWVWESNPGPTKRSSYKVKELKPGPIKKIMCKARGSNLGLTKKSLVQSCTRYLIKLLIRL